MVPLHALERPDLGRDGRRGSGARARLEGVVQGENGAPGDDHGRSRTFRSSRMFPGQSYATRRFMAAAGTRSILLLSVGPISPRKNQTNTGCLFRSRRHGSLVDSLQGPS